MLPNYFDILTQDLEFRDNKRVLYSKSTTHKPYPHSEEFGTVIEDYNDTNVDSEKNLSLEQKLELAITKKNFNEPKYNTEKNQLYPKPSNEKSIYFKMRQDVKVRNQTRPSSATHRKTSGYVHEFVAIESRVRLLPLKTSCRRLMYVICRGSKSPPVYVVCKLGEWGASAQVSYSSLDQGLKLPNSSPTVLVKK
ncbi:hypothetical protein TNCV_2302331 [Trichonephila clavipes]|nr:hypothetical protein TNCV_2302331 [Trichonephila clavipes]